jgi:L-alanine-DL-glutamate epimerase-like enolase superfamily enzyme
MPKLCHGGRLSVRTGNARAILSEPAGLVEIARLSVSPRILAVRELTVPLGLRAANAAIRYDDMTVSLIAVATDIVRRGRRVVGFGLDSHGRFGHGKLLLERFVPRVLAADPASLLDADGATLDPAAVWRAAMRDEKPGGHGERAGALGLLDMAIWDIVAKLADKPLWRVLAERHGVASDGRTFVYASGGHYRPGSTPADDLAALRAELRSHVAAGFTLAKIKVGGAALDHDVARIEAALAIMGDGARLAVDANAALDRARAEAYLDRLARYRLAWIEEPCGPLDFTALAALASRYAPPLATGENLFAAEEVRNLLRHGGLRRDRDLIQVDIALAYGLVEYERILALLAAQGWTRDRCLPHAGHFLSLQAAAGLGLAGHESAPDPSLILGGFPDGLRVENGQVQLDDQPGIGFERKPALYQRLASLVDA